MSRMKGTLARSTGAISPVTARLRSCNVRSHVALSNEPAVPRRSGRGRRYALATMCIGGGQGIAAIFERV